MYIRLYLYPVQDGTMKAMILAAGRGERMRPLTDKTPKPLIKVNGQPLVVYHLKALAKAGITKVIINTWYLGDQIIDAIGNGQAFGLNVEYSIETELLNTGGGIVKALPMLGFEPFIVLSADIFTDFPLPTLPRSPAGLAHLVMVDNPTYHTEGDFVLDKGKIKLNGAPKFTYGNIGVFRPEFFVNAPSNAFPLGDLMRKHIANDQVTGQYYNGSWNNVGSPADLELVSNSL